MEFTMAGLGKTAVNVLDFFVFFELCTNTAKHIDKTNQVAATKQRAVHLAQQKGRGTPGRGGRGGGRGGRGGRGTPPPGRGTTPERFDWKVPADNWAAMSAEEKQTHIDKVKVSKAAAIA